MQKNVVRFGRRIPLPSTVAIRHQLEAEAKRQTHPELQRGEVFLGNFKRPDFVAWSTKRVGEQSYDQDGQPYGPIFGFRPVFVSRVELAKANVSFS